MGAGLLAPCLLAFASLRPGWRRLLVPALVLCVALGTTALSTALNFGPAHAWTWVTPAVVPGLVVGFALSVAAAALKPRIAAALGLVALATAVSLGARPPPDPYLAPPPTRGDHGPLMSIPSLF